MADQEQQEEIDYNQGYFLMPRELRAACAQVHKNTAQLVEFIAEQTFGWHSRWVYLTYDEIKNGRRKQNGERMGPGSYLTQDKQVRRAIADALAQGLIEVRYLAWGTAFAIHRRFWASSKLIPRWEFFKRTSYSPQDDPIPYTQAAVKKTEDEQQKEEAKEQDGQTSVKKTATDYQIDSRQLSKRQEAASKLTEGTSQKDRLQQVRRGPIDTSLDTSPKYNKIDTFGASATASRPDVLIEIEKELEEAKKTEDAPSPSAPADATIPASAPARDVGTGAAATEVAEAEKRRREQAQQDAVARHQERLAQREALKALYADKSRQQQQHTEQEATIRRALKKAGPCAALGRGAGRATDAAP